MRVRSILNRAKQSWADRSLRKQIRKVEDYLRKIPLHEDSSPVLFFNASTRIHRLSLNGAYSLLASWALRNEGIPVRYLVCHSGMTQCVLGATLGDPPPAPPCRTCIRFSSYLYPEELTIALKFRETGIVAIREELNSLDLEALKAWNYKDLPLGELCLPGLRWSLRRDDLIDDKPTRRLFRQFLTSGESLQGEYGRILDELQPQALVIFNGIFYPEAILREVALRRDIPVVTHEVGLRPFSAFLTHEHATFRKVDLPEGFELTEDQNERLDSYLENRFGGRFSMAGVQFWPEMVDLPEEITDAIDRFKQTVVVFTNVIFDTSQVHANNLFEDMFAWLEYLEVVIKDHPETLFIFRAHPDEDRPGKSSQQSVTSWVKSRGLSSIENFLFIPPSDYVSSYDLIERSKFVLAYNSSIGIEATILGSPVLMAGRARYSHEPTAFIPENAREYSEMLETFLRADEILVPSVMIETARRLLYLELFHASLDLSAFLTPDPVIPGMVIFSNFDPHEMECNDALRVIREGILKTAPFRMPIT